MPGKWHVPRGKRRGVDEPEARVNREVAQPTTMVRLVVRGALSAERAKAGSRPGPKAHIRLHVVERAAAENQEGPLAELPTREAHRGLERGAGAVVEAQEDRHVGEKRG